MVNILFDLEWEVFKRVITETNVGHIFFTKRTEFHHVEVAEEGGPEVEKLEKLEEGESLGQDVFYYDLYTSAGGFIIKTSVVKNNVKEAIMFEESYLKKPKVVPISEIIEKDIILNIAKG